MTILFSDELFQGHQTHNHAETPQRLVSIEAALKENQLAQRCVKGKIRPINETALANVHDPIQIAAAKRLSEQGGGHLEPDTILSERSYEVALMAAGTACAAVDAVMQGQQSNALCLIRPPGHHATPTNSMGFCIFNNVAIAARHAQSQYDVARILIVDWDVHHGNGTQDIFYDIENVVFYSIHRHPFYPNTGTAAETGTGRGLGSTINVPVSFGTGRKLYLEMFQRGLEKAASLARPELILISAGFDAHHDDPIGNLGLLSDDFAIMTASVKDIAKQFCCGRIVSCLEGGYNLTALAESVSAHLRELLVLS